MSPRDEWRASALCLQVPPETFDNDGQGASAHQALRICRACEVRAECLEDALRVERIPGNESTGVVGGMTAKHRRRIIINERRGAGAAA